MIVFVLCYSLQTTQASFSVGSQLGSRFKISKILIIIVFSHVSFTIHHSFRRCAKAISSRLTISGSSSSSRIAGTSSSTPSAECTQNTIWTLHRSLPFQRTHHPYSRFRRSSSRSRSCIASVRLSALLYTIYRSRFVEFRCILSLISYYHRTLPLTSR